MTEERRLEVVRAGPLTTVQDRGRPGWAHLGVPRSGALDRPALDLANGLVGNPPGAAVLETTLLGTELRAGADLVVAVTGAEAAVEVGGLPATTGAPIGVRRGETLRVGRAARGVRSYVAVRGGLDVEPVLGSRSTDTLSGIGPAPLSDGRLLPVGEPSGTASAADTGNGPAAPSLGPMTVRVRLGPREDRLTAAARVTLATAPFRVSARSDRVGLRLDGPALRWRDDEEMDSEGIVLGAVQVPPDGSPIVFLADHPTTGGYPVVAVVEPHDLPLLAQARPGTELRLVVGPQR
ncbi:MAG: hypothetical protein QOJ60_3243 [Actinomycetota bacterium]|nr:hypothetical protein [Actinomycetota bacterium]